MYIQLHGTAIDVNVRLDKSSLMMEDTFLGLTSQRYCTTLYYVLLHVYVLLCVNWYTDAKVN